MIIAHRLSAVVEADEILVMEADSHLVELAVAGGARFVVTRNLRDVARIEPKFPEL